MEDILSIFWSDSGSMTGSLTSCSTGKSVGSGDEDDVGLGQLVKALALGQRRGAQRGKVVAGA